MNESLFHWSSAGRSHVGMVRAINEDACLAMPELGLWAVPVNLITTYFLVGLELIAECIEEPFGKGDDNLPLDQICENIAKSLDEILGSTTSDTAFESALDSDAAATIRTEEE